jgi:hypothetical protein
MKTSTMDESMNLTTFIPLQSPDITCQVLYILLNNLDVLLYEGYWNHVIALKLSF